MKSRFDTLVLKLKILGLNEVLMDIKTGELLNPEVIKLLQAYHNDMLKDSLVESVHALDVSKLTKEI